MLRQLSDPGDTEGLADLAAALRVDATARAVIDAMHAAGVEPILLKGATLAFLYARDARRYVDVDVLVRPHHRAQAQTVLRSLGYRKLLEGAAPSESPSTADPWVKPGSPAVDLHHRLTGAPTAHSDDQWTALEAHVVGGEVAGTAVQVLDMAGRALVCASHVTSTGLTSRHPRHDLSRALTAIGRDDWRRATDLARALGMEDVMAAGLRTVLGGAELADELGLPVAIPLGLELARSGAPSEAQSLARFAKATARERLGLIRRALVPSPASIRLTAPTAQRGRWGLVLAYLLRPVSVARRLPGAVRAVRRARRRST